MLLFLLISVIATLSSLLLFTRSLVPFGLACFFLTSSLCYLAGYLISSWMGIIIFLIYIGGLMVIFGYFLAICPNQLISFRGVRPRLYCVAIIFLVLVTRSEEIVPAWATRGMSITALYTPESFSLLALIVLTLLLTLIAVVKVVELGQGPLRPFENRKQGPRQ